MTKRKTLGRKPHAGNPLRSRALGFGAAFASAVLCGTAQARVAYSLDGSRMTITASSEYKGKGLVLLWDETDKGENAADWANRTNILMNVSNSGTTVTVNLADYGIENGTPCRIAASTCYERLETLYMGDKQCYINTGFKDTEVYGVRFGFYGNSSDTSFGYCIGSTEGVSGEQGFVVGMSGAAYDKYLWTYRGVSATDALNCRPTAYTDKINEVAFTNRVFTMNGVSVWRTLLAAGSVGASTTNMFIGKCGRGLYATSRYFYGHWSHVSFDDAEGNKILDYVPVRRGSDNKVGFWDYATSKFVTSTGTGNFTADAVKTPAETIDRDLEVVSEVISPNRELTFTLEGSALAVSVPAGLVGERLVLLWDDEDMGDDPAAWSHSAVISESARAAGETVRVGKLGVKNGQYVRVAAANAYKTLETLYMGDKQCYINTGFKDTEVYGVRFGFYGNSCSEPSGGWGYCIGSKEGTAEARGFVVGMSGTSYDKFFWTYTGKRPDAPDRPATSTTSINEIAFTNRVFTLDGKNVFGTLAAGSVGISTSNIFIGKCGGDYPTQRYFYGYWSHVSFDDADGNKILDYVPVRRVASDGTLGKVGFYDRATKTFVTSTGTGDFTAGAVKDDEEVISYNSVSAAAEVNGIPGFMIIFR